MDVELDCCWARDCTADVDDGAATVVLVVKRLGMVEQPNLDGRSKICEDIALLADIRSIEGDEAPPGYKKGRMGALPLDLDDARRHDEEAATAAAATDREDMLQKLSRGCL